jgi:hypothetical protein
MANNHSTNGMHGVHPYRSPGNWIVWLTEWINSPTVTERGKDIYREMLKREIKQFEHLKK